MSRTTAVCGPRSRRFVRIILVCSAFGIGRWSTAAVWVYASRRNCGSRKMEKKKKSPSLLNQLTPENERKSLPRVLYNEWFMCLAHTHAHTTLDGGPSLLEWRAFGTCFKLLLKIHAIVSDVLDGVALRYWIYWFLVLPTFQFKYECDLHISGVLIELVDSIWHCALLWAPA